MKRLTVLTFLLIMVCTLAGCIAEMHPIAPSNPPRTSTETHPVAPSNAPSTATEAESVIEISVTVADGSVTLSEEDALLLQDILESEAWINDITKCEPDCKLSFSDTTLYYHSECGSFINSNARQSLILSEALRLQVNQLLEAYVTLGQLF